MSKVAVIGAGSWGTALASVLANNQHEVRMHTNLLSIVEDINTNHRNERYLPGETLPSSIVCSMDYQTVLQEADYVLFVVPSHVMREVAKQAAPFIEPHAVIIHASKGIEVETLKRLSVVLQEELPSTFHEKIVAFSGPSHAEEVIKQMPTAIVSACPTIAYAKDVQRLFMNETFRVYSSDDIVGVELGGSLKNIIALGAGLSDGLGYGDNAKAALLTRGLAEMSKLGIALGANPLTFNGLAGIGDLIVTGTSVHSRNWRTGNLLAKGSTLQEALDSLGMVAEGVKTTKAVHRLANELHIDLPITAQLYAVLFEGADPATAVKNLMERDMKEEFHHL